MDIIVTFDWETIKFIAILSVIPISIGLHIYYNITDKDDNG